MLRTYAVILVARHFFLQLKRIVAVRCVRNRQLRSFAPPSHNIQAQVQQASVTRRLLPINEYADEALIER